MQKSCTHSGAARTALVKTFGSFEHMSASFDPRLDILPQSQLRLWPELDTVPSDFILYGGTGLALQLGHRASEGFDLFSSSGFEPDCLRSRLPFFRDLDPKDPETWVRHKQDNLEAFVNRGGLVKVAFFGGLDTLHCRGLKTRSRLLGPACGLHPWWIWLA
jgi:hypothetical protein